MAVVQFLNCATAELNQTFWGQNCLTIIVNKCFSQQLFAPPVLLTHPQTSEEPWSPPLICIFCQLKMIKVLTYSLILCFSFFFFHCPLRNIFRLEPVPRVTSQDNSAQIAINNSKNAPAQSLWIEWHCEAVTPYSKTSPSTASPIICVFKLCLVFFHIPITPRQKWPVYCSSLTVWRRKNGEARNI